LRYFGSHLLFVWFLSQSTGLAASQIPPQGTLDDQIIAYFSSVTTLESSASSLQEGQSGPSATPEITNSEALQPPGYSPVLVEF
jgi:hypothetical protein